MAGALGLDLREEPLMSWPDGQTLSAKIFTNFGKKQLLGSHHMLGPPGGRGGRAVCLQRQRISASAYLCL